MSKATRLAWILALGTLVVVPGTSSPVRAQDAEAEAKEKKEIKPGEEMPVYGETLVVTASRTEEKVADAPVSITVIGPEKLETTAGGNYAEVSQCYGFIGKLIPLAGERQCHFKSLAGLSIVALAKEH